MNDDREIRIFISSTFRDMFAEREVLVKKVFPQLRKLCAERFVSFTEVDLRWGITDEQKAEGRVLPLCLAEIDRCRPFFIGILGERYGWIPAADAFSEKLLQEQPWLKEHADGASVTELEIVHGVLGKHVMRGRAFFYFRDPAYGAAFLEDRKRELNEQPIPYEIEAHGLAEAQRRAEKRRERLQRIKERIRESGYPVREDYGGPDDLARLVIEDLTGVIEGLYPKQEAQDPDEREAQAHEAYARSRRFCYVELPGTLDALDVHFANEQPPLVVIGESGGGKSALLARWAERHQETHPDDFLFHHYFGASPESSQALGAVRRLLSALKRRFDLTEEIPAEPDKLREALPLWLAQTVGRGRIVLIFDALNQVEGEERDLQLDWLPRYFPPHIRVLCSALPGPALDAIAQRGWPTFELRRPDSVERRQMIESFLGHYRKTLPADPRDRLASAPQAANPLYLRTVLEELRQFGRHEELAACLDDYLAATDPMALFRRVLRRWRADFDDGDRQLTARALTHLWAARQGLAETEWLELLGSTDNPLPRAEWTPLFLAMEPHLSSRGGLHTFGHEYLRRAVEAELLPESETQRAAHVALADYFENLPEMTPRKAAEWPWQLQHAEQWDRLQGCLTDSELFFALYNDLTKWELTGYWLPLRDRGIDMEACYREVWSEWEHSDPDEEAVAFRASLVASFLRVNGVYSFAEMLYASALEGYERVLGPEHPYTLTSVNNLALLLQNKGDYAQAEPLCRRALEGYERVLGPEHPYTLTSVKNLALLLQNKGDYAQAEPLCRRALESRESVLGPEHPDTLTSVNNLALLLQNKGDYAQAEPLYRRALESRERVLGPEHPDTLSSVSCLAHFLQSKGDYAQAEPLLRRALEGYERVLGVDHPYTLLSVNNLTLLLDSTGDYSQAEPLYRRTLEAQERVFGPEHPDTLLSVSNLALLLYNQGHYAQAEPLYRRALESRERVLGAEHPDTLISVYNLAVLMATKGNYLQAETLHRRALESSEQVLGPEHPDTLDTMSELAVLLYSKGDYAQAEHLYRRALAGYERVLGPDHPFALGIARNLAQLLHSKGDYAQAEMLCRKALEGFEHKLGKEHPRTLRSVNDLAGLLKSDHDYDRAEVLYQLALEGLNRVLGKEHAWTLESLNDLAALLEEKGDYARAEPLYRRALESRERVLGAEHPSTLMSVNNLAWLLRTRGNSTEAESLYRKTLSICEGIDVNARSRQVFQCMATSHNELAFHTEVPARNWKEAENHYRQAIELFTQIEKPTDAANVELNLQTLFNLSGQPVDQEKVKEATGILDAAGDQRAEKGRKLLQELE